MKWPGKMIRQLLRSLLKRPATVFYPRVKVTMPQGFRGCIKFDPAKCIGCKMCMRDCPTGAIEIIKLPDGQFEARINLGLCAFCGQCVDTCPKHALEASGEFELARLSRDSLILIYRPKPKPKQP